MIYNVSPVAAGSYWFEVLGILLAIGFVFLLNTFIVLASEDTRLYVFTLILAFFIVIGINNRWDSLPEPTNIPVKGTLVNSGATMSQGRNSYYIPAYTYKLENGLLVTFTSQSGQAWPQEAIFYQNPERHK